MRLVLAVLAILLLNGCALMNRPSPEQIAKADYGTFPFDYQVIVKEYMDTVLKDPSSAQYSDWRGPDQGYVSNMNGAFFGYRVCVFVNAKNSYGGYTGKQPHAFVIKNNTVIQHQGGGISGTVGLEESYRLCNSISSGKMAPGKFVIGITTGPVTASGDLAKSEADSIGHKVASVTKNSRAEKSGIIVGDLITKIGTTEIKSGNDISKSISEMNEGDSISILILRNNKPIELKLSY